MLRLIQSQIQNQLRKALRPTLSIACDNIALNLLKSFNVGYLPWTGAAIRPAALCGLLNEIIINQRQKLIEFGAGISTIYIAHALKNTGGHITSFEHDKQWYDLIAKHLVKHQLQQTVTLVHAPLTPCTYAIGTCKWYDCEVVQSHLKGLLIDGVIVDGPPASSRGLELARYPAVPALREFLAESFFIYLDDIDRQGECEIFEKWQALLSLEGKAELIAGNYGILRLGGQFATTITH
jgi:hypothetical protein